MVGYTEGLHVKLQPKFGLEGKRVKSQKTIKVVTIEDYPMVQMSREKLEVGEVCVLRVNVCKDRTFSGPSQNFEFAHTLPIGRL